MEDYSRAEPERYSRAGPEDYSREEPEGYSRAGQCTQKQVEGQEVAVWEVKYAETCIITWVPAQSNVWGRQRAACHPWPLLSELGWREAQRQTHI